ncbi:MAG: DUF4382 domain-containing protein [Acidobacteria bacterium]|nr:DUF4382 domain-containing protein [Acidobacteriota bacterium]
MRATRHIAILAFLAVGALSFLVGCGSSPSTSGGSSNSVGGTPTGNVLINVADDPGDRVVSFTVTINSIALIPQTGQPVTVFSTPTQVEITQLAGTSMPLGIATVPQNTYVGAQITVSNPTIAILNPDGSTKTIPLPPGPLTVNVKFDAPVTTSASGTAINFDLRILGSISIDAGGNVTLTPDFHANGGPLGNPGQQGPFDGGLSHFGGKVSAVGTSSFAVSLGSQTLTFNVNSSTQFKGVSGLGSLATGMMVFVDASTQSDGSLLATKVRVITLNPSFSLDGIVASVTGTPATQLGLIFRDHISMPGPPQIGARVLVTVGTATFEIDNDDFNLTGLTFTPVFDASHIFAGQLVEVTATKATPNAGSPPTVTASDIQLEPQALAGTPSNENGASFTLTLASDSAFATLTGATSVTVFTTSQTRFDNVSGVSALGSTAKTLARGFLFHDQGQWKLVAMFVGQ